MLLTLQQRQALTNWFTSTVKYMRNQSSRNMEATLRVDFFSYSAIKAAQVKIALEILNGKTETEFAIHAFFLRGRKLIDKTIESLFANPKDIPNTNLSTAAYIAEAKQYLKALCAECAKTETDLDNLGNLRATVDSALGYTEPLTAAAPPPGAGDDAIRRAPEPVEVPPPAGGAGREEAVEHPLVRRVAITPPRHVIPARDEEGTLLRSMHLPVCVGIQGRDNLATAGQTQFKILLIGNSGSKKTVFLNLLAGDQYSANFIKTIGIDFKIYLDKEKGIKYQIWDTAGQERFRTITTGYFSGTHCVVILPDAEMAMDQRQKNIEFWQEEALKHRPDLKFYTVHLEREAVQLKEYTRETLESALRQSTLPAEEITKHGRELLRVVAEKSFSLGPAPAPAPAPAPSKRGWW